MKNSKNIFIFYIALSICAVSSITTGFAEESGPVINEFMSSNSKTIEDEDGDYSDWIEIYNAGSSPADLTGYGLSDRADDSLKWIFPDYTLDAGEHLLIFASGKDRKAVVKHWETVITQGDEWKYFPGSTVTPNDWPDLDFDDSGWDSGPSGFGFGDDDDETIINQVTAFYIRKKFNVEDVANISQCLLQIDYDDAFVAYINGTEIARANIPGTVGTPPPNFQTSTESIEAKMYSGGNPSVFSIDNIQSLLNAGENVLAIQVHNRNILDTDLTAIPFLTFGMSAPPANPRGLPEILRFSLTNSLHTNFKINITGETLVLADSTGIIVDQVDAIQLTPDMSRGRLADGGTEWVYFSEPTPGTGNAAQGYGDYAALVTASIPGGLYDNIVTVELSVNSSNAEIRYTLDGAEPTESSTKYVNPISIDKTSVLRARAFEVGFLPGKINTNTYLINEQTTLPIVSLSTDPDNFFSEETGIYVNYWREWEKPVHLEFFEPDGTQGFETDAGATIYGQGTRGYPEKTLAIYLRDKYGYESVNYQIFPDLPITEFKSFLLRSSGNDFKLRFTMFRDPLQQELVKDIDIDNQAYRPSIVFINGEYWGIHNIREKLNESYIESHHGVDREILDFIYPSADLDENGKYVYGGWDTIHSGDVDPILRGDSEHYDAMIEYLNTHDMTKLESYEYMKTQIDMNEYLNFYTHGIYCSRCDWPGQNCKFFRPRTPDGKWRWMAFDYDCGFAIHHRSVYTFDTFYFIAETAEADKRRNPPATTLIFRKLLENSWFVDDLTNRYLDYTNTIFSPEVVIAKIGEMKAVIEPEMPRHLEKWGSTDGSTWGTMSIWNENVAMFVDFANNRIPYVNQFFSERFNFENGTAVVNLDVDNPEKGKIKLNCLTLDEYPFSGTYFKDVPVHVTAVPNPGYRFVGWQGIDAGDTLTTVVSLLAGDRTITANFVQDSGSSDSIVINEINYNSSSDFDTEDWVEFYNTSDSAIDISNWIFKDDDDTHEFIFSENTVIEAHGYSVLCRNDTLFTALFPDVSDYVGNLSFGLANGGDSVRLFDAKGAVIDSLTYDNNAPWPVEPDGNGCTLSLSDPGLDNALSESWAASVMHGTPGAENRTAQDYAVMINEINYNSSNDFNPEDWVEFYNPGSSSVDMSGWI
ncbi:MAG: hypothetical protein HOC71_09510, partial [Candidatus Latescibacteria bacterium]|nr:hypothetical protein [Candidatus Latescibacterota bacterium]